jgi:FkbM family methyltransferase
VKALILKFLHRVLGYDNYLRLFSICKINMLWLDSRKSDFLFFETLLSEKANILVVGACTGITTIPFAKNHPKRKIFAYEPLASNFQALTDVIGYYRLSNVFSYPVGMGDRKEERQIVLPLVDGVKKQGMAHIVDPSIPGYEKGEHSTVNLDFIDNRPELKQITIDGIKVVAENFEQAIFKGAQSLLLRDAPLIYCELWDNPNRDHVLDLLKTYNYCVFYRKGTILLPFEKGSYSGKNFFLKPRNE